MSVRIAIVSARAARGLDDDEHRLVAALAALSARVDVVAWDDAGADWGVFDLAVVRSTWDYMWRLPEFLAWAEAAAAVTRLENPLPVLRWNTDKHYLEQLARVLPPGTVIPGRFIEPGEDAAAGLRAFLDSAGGCREVVVKPAVGGGSIDVLRHPREKPEQITAHIRQLQAAGRSVQLQPYLGRVDTQGETALIYFGGVFSHAIRKGPLLQRQGAAFEGTPDGTVLFAREQITPCTPASDEHAVAQQVLAVLTSGPLAERLQPGGPPLYARVDLLWDEEGRPRLLELELSEPSLFLTYAPEAAAARFAAAIVVRATA